ncbi:MAG: DUF4493 domain-containing protein, partial [Bacteroidaceae bacterium]
MKKIILSVCALVALAFTSCSNEVDMFETIGTPKGTLSVNCTYDTELSTRAAQNADATWIIKAGETTLSQGTNTIPAGTYTVTASNYAGEAAALEANGSWGDAFYTGSQSGVVVNKGANTDINIACGKAQNARMKVNFNLLASFTDVKLVADPTTTVPAYTGRNLEFNAGENAGKLAYFAASATVKCKLSYTFSGSVKEKNFDFALAGAATENVITVKTN